MTSTADNQITERPEHIFASLRGVSLFSNLPDEEIACFQKVAQIRSYKKGKIIYIQGDPAQFFYIIRGGWVKLFHTMPGGEEVIIDMLTTGHVFGDSAIFELGRHTSSAQVIEDVQLLSIPANLLKVQIHLNSKLAYNMLTSMSRHHRHHHGELAFNAMLSAPQRIACFLLRLCPKGKRKGIVFHLPYDKSLIADTLNMKNATLSRALKVLSQKTGILIKGTRVEIYSVDQLMKFVYGPLAEKYKPEDM